MKYILTTMCVTLSVIETAVVHAQSDSTRRSALDTATVRAIIREVEAERAKTRDSGKRFGLSIGPRLLSRRIIEYSLNPDGTLQVESSTNRDMVLSGLFFAPLWGKGRNFGILANFALSKWQPDNFRVFNERIEGGFGVAWRLKDHYLFAATFEEARIREKRSSVQFAPEDVTVPAGNFSLNDNRMFFDRHVSALAFKFGVLF